MALRRRTSARVLHHSFEVRHGPEDRSFRRALGLIAGAPFVDGNRVDTLVNGDEFIPAMVGAIRAAKRSVTFENYIWASGQISDSFIEALAERARSGVSVRVLIDGMGSLKFSRADRDRLRASGARLVTYGREHWYDFRPNINHRTHRKLLIVDGEVGFTGGMGVDDLWAGNGSSPGNWRDTQIRVAGPVVLQMQAAFAANWLETTGELLIGDDYFPESDSVGGMSAQCLRSGPDDNPENIRVAHFYAIASAQESVDIAQAYFVPDDLAIEKLIQARKRNVRIRVIVPAINDSRFGRAASRSRWGKLIAAGVEFYAYQPAMYHCKVMIVDGRLVTHGSTNFDNRSFSINDEVAVNILDAAAAASDLAVFERDLAVSRRILREEFESRSVFVKLADHFCGLFRSQL